MDAKTVERLNIAVLENRGKCHLAVVQSDPRLTKYRLFDSVFDKFIFHHNGFIVTMVLHRCYTKN